MSTQNLSHRVGNKLDRIRANPSFEFWEREKYLIDYRNFTFGERDGLLFQVWSKIIGFFSWQASFAT